MLAGLSSAQRASVWRALGISAAFGAVSVMTSFSFKAIFSVYRFDATFTLLGLQMALTLAFTALLRARCQGVPGLEVPRQLEAAALQASLVPGLLFVANIAVGFYGIKLVSIPMFLTVRRTTTLFTLAAEYLVLGLVASRSVAAGVLLTVLGALVAGADSLRTDWLGFAFVVGNNVMTAASWSATKRFSDRFRLTRFGLTYYNACVALPLCVVLAAAGGEFQYVARHPQIGSPGMLLALFGASALGVLMNWVTFLAVTQTSPLATSITGNVKDIFATFLGAAIFRDFTPTFPRVAGIAISFVGSAVFSLAKLREVRDSGLGGGGAGGAGAGGGGGGGGAGAGGGGGGAAGAGGASAAAGLKDGAAAEAAEAAERWRSAASAASAAGASSEEAAAAEGAALVARGGGGGGGGLAGAAGAHDVEVAVAAGGAAEGAPGAVGGYRR